MANLEESILRVIVVDQSGNILGHISKPEFDERFHMPAHLGDTSGVRITLLEGIAEQLDEVFGTCQSITIVYKKSKLVRIPIDSQRIIIALVIQRSADDAYVTDKVRAFLGE